MTITEDGASSTMLDEGALTDNLPPRARRVRRSLLVGLGVGAVLGAGWWWSHPTLYGEVGDEFGARPERLVPVYVDMGLMPEDEQASIISARPRVQVFGEAQAEVLLCEGAQIGIVYGTDVEPPCSPIGFQGAATSGDQVVLRVTPESPGAVVVVDGIDLTYTTGLQRGTEHTGTAGVIVFPADQP